MLDNIYLLLVPSLLSFYPHKDLTELQVRRQAQSGAVTCPRGGLESGLQGPVCKAGPPPNPYLLFSLDGVHRGHVVAGNVASLSRAEGPSLPPVTLAEGTEQAAALATQPLGHHGARQGHTEDQVDTGPANPSPWVHTLPKAFVCSAPSHCSCPGSFSLLKEYVWGHLGLLAFFSGTSAGLGFGRAVDS